MVLGNRSIQLPKSLEVVSGLFLADAVVFDELTALPNLKELQTHVVPLAFALDPTEQQHILAVQRFQALRPAVQIVQIVNR